MKKIRRHKVNSAIAVLVYEKWDLDASYAEQLLARGELIRALQALSDENIEIALAEGYHDGREDFGVPVK